MVGDSKKQVIVGDYRMASYSTHKLIYIYMQHATSHCSTPSDYHTNTISALFSMHDGMPDNDSHYSIASSAREHQPHTYVATWLLYVVGTLSYLPHLNISSPAIRFVVNFEEEYASKYSLNSQQSKQIFPLWDSP